MKLAGVAVLGVPLGGVLAFRTVLNPDVRVVIDKTATERAALFASDPAFGRLSVSAVHRKVVNLIMSGSLASQEMFRRLRARLVAECPTAAGCRLHRDITLRDAGGRIDGTDRELFRD